MDVVLVSLDLVSAALSGTVVPRVGSLNITAAWMAVEGSFPVAFTAVYVAGFIAAVGIGSIAWYNSKRPPGWEGRDRPNMVPKVKSDDDSEDQ